MIPSMIVRPIFLLLKSELEGFKSRKVDLLMNSCPRGQLGCRISGSKWTVPIWAPSSVLDKILIFLPDIYIYFQQRNQKLCFSSSATLHHSVKLLSAFVAVPFWSCNTPWPLEAPTDTVADLWPPPSPLLLQIRAPTGQRRAGQLLPSTAATGSCCLPDWGHWELGWVWEWRASWCHPYWWLRSTSTRPASTQTCWLRCSTWWSPGSSCCSTSTRSSAEVSHRDTFVTIKKEHFKMLHITGSLLW